MPCSKTPTSLIDVLNDGFISSRKDFCSVAMIASSLRRPECPGPPRKLSEVPIHRALSPLKFPEFRHPDRRSAPGYEGPAAHRRMIPRPTRSRLWVKTDRHDVLRSTAGLPSTAERPAAACSLTAFVRDPEPHYVDRLAARAHFADG